MDKVYQHDQVHYELDGDGNNQTPVEDRSRWLLSVELLERFIEAEHHKDDRDTQTEIGRLIVTHFHSVKVECAHCVRGEQTIKRKDLVLLECRSERRATLLDRLLDRFQRAIFISEWCSNACVAKLKLRISRTCLFLVLFHVLLHVFLLLCWSHPDHLFLVWPHG